MLIFIKDLEVRNDGRRGYMWALFKCPTCGRDIERAKRQGIAQQECKECFYAGHKISQTKHGGRYKRLYRTWTNMRARCNNPNERDYKYYGKIGVSICTEWDNYIDFEIWAINSGYNDSLTIDRIDVLGNYTPENCEWVSKSENARKARTIDAKRRREKKSE